MRLSLLVIAGLAASPALAAPNDGWRLPMKPAALTPAQTDAIMRAAGFAKAGRRWTGCEGQSAATIDDEAAGGAAIRDLNGDGRPEVIVTDSGGCYGATGAHFVILAATATGWKTFYEEIGVPTFLATRGVGGWADVEVGGPGFCFPVQRWNGREYAVVRHQYEGKPCRR